MSIPQTPARNVFLPKCNRLSAISAILRGTKLAPITAPTTRPTTDCPTAASRSTPMVPTTRIYTHRPARNRIWKCSNPDPSETSFLSRTRLNCVLDLAGDLAPSLLFVTIHLSLSSLAMLKPPIALYILWQPISFPVFGCPKRHRASQQLLSGERLPACEK